VDSQDLRIRTSAGNKERISSRARRAAAVALGTTLFVAVLKTRARVQRCSEINRLSKSPKTTSPDRIFPVTWHDQGGYVLILPNGDSSSSSRFPWWSSRWNFLIGRWPSYWEQVVSPIPSWTLLRLRNFRFRQTCNFLCWRGRSSVGLGWRIRDRLLRVCVVMRVQDSSPNPQYRWSVPIYTRAFT
jgi:hypothetical protein